MVHQTLCGGVPGLSAGACGSRCPAGNGGVFGLPRAQLPYRFELPKGSSPEVPQGVLIYFHGNNMGTQEQMLDGSFSYVRRHGVPLGLVPWLSLRPARPSPTMASCAIGTSLTSG